MIHGQSRVRRQEIPLEEIKRQEEQAEKVLNQTAYFFKIRQQLVPQPENPLAYCELLAKLCSEITTIYNYRRELLVDLINSNLERIQLQQIEADAKVLVDIIIRELDMLTSLLKRHPKSYTLWSYREWLVVESVRIDKLLGQMGLQEGLLIQAVKKEFHICAKMLQMDERNFHVWNYRNWLVSLSGQGSVEEFTAEKIRHNFSNFSAYHFRSKYFLSHYNTMEKIQERIKLNSELNINRGDISCPLSPMPLDIVRMELIKIQEAIYIQPKEQGVYLYHKWLLGVIQPYGVVSIKKIDKINNDQSNNSGSNFLIVLNKRSKNLNLPGCIQVKLGGEVLEINKDFAVATQNNKDYDNFYTLKFNNIVEDFEIRFDNNILLNRIDDGSQEEEQTNSRYFIPITYNLVGQQVTFSSQDEDTLQGLKQIQNILDENIEFIDSVLDEENNLKYALLQRAVFQGYKMELQILMSYKSQEVLKTASQVLQTYTSIEPQEPSIKYNIVKWTDIVNSFNTDEIRSDVQGKYWKYLEKINQ